MPPCAAIEWARRGESWKQKQETWYPSSAREAAADAPASPDPTTMTWNFRLLAGETRRRSARCRSHFASSGPAGILASSFIACSWMQEAQHRAERDGEEATGHQHGKADGDHLPRPVPDRVIEAEGLECRPE